MKTDDQVAEALQHSITSWGNHLIATGGTIKSDKCLYHHISFHWSKDDTWHYIDNVDDMVYPVSVPVPNVTTLGMNFSTSGDYTSSLNLIKDKALKWLDGAMSNKLPHRSFWFNVDWQVWGYDLCCNVSSLETL
ncbi:hypothetical protein ACHAW6_013963 [Cyclotella cf. meneghiniana]